MSLPPSPGDPVSVTIQFWTRPDNLIPEAEAASFFTAQPGGLERLAEQSGMILVRHGDTEIELPDTLAYLVNKLCIEAVADVVEHGAADVSFFSSDMQVTMRRDGNAVELAGNTFYPVRLPALPLLNALLDAAARFIGLVEQLWPQDAPGALVGIRPREAAVRAQVAAWAETV